MLVMLSRSLLAICFAQGRSYGCFVLIFLIFLTFLFAQFVFLPDFPGVF